MEPFAEKPIDNLASTCIEFNRANGGVSGGASHKFNSIRHGRETAGTAMVEKLQKLSRLRNCRNRPLYAYAML